MRTRIQLGEIGVDVIRKDIRKWIFLCMIVTFCAGCRFCAKLAASEKMSYRKLLYPVVPKTFPSLATSSLLNSDCGS